MSITSSDESITTPDKKSKAPKVQDVPEAQEKKKLKRRKHKKSRVGCPQCRKRKIKCDETLPACTRCVNRNVRCGYMDYNEKMLDAVKLAHWEADGADPMKFPLQQPSFGRVQQQFPNSVYHQQQPTLQNLQQIPNASSFHNNSFAINDLYDLNDLHDLNHHNNFSDANDFTDFNDLQESPISNVVPHTNNHMLNYYLTEYIDHVPYQSSILLSPDEAVVIPPLYNKRLGASSDSNSDYEQYSDDCSSGILSNAESIILNSNGIFRNPADLVNSNSESIQNDISDHADKLLAASNFGDFKLKMISHEDKFPPVQMDEFPYYFNENFSEFTARIYVKRLAFTNFLYSRYHLTVFISTLLLGGYGPFLRSHPEFKELALEARGTCMNYLLEELLNINDDNAIPLLRISNVLNCTSVFFPKEVSLKQHFHFASGPSSILAKIYENPSHFPKAFPAIKNYANVVFFTLKYVWVPEYDHQVLYEFLNVLKEFGLRYNLASKRSRLNRKLNEQHENLIKIIEFSIDLFENTDKAEEDLVIRYPIEKLFDLLQLWYSVVPTEMFTMGSQTPNLQKVLNVFWFAFIKIIESLLINIRYIFCFFLDGLFLVHCFKKEELLVGLNDDQLKWYLNYCSRIISFFDRRMTYLFSNTILNEPIPIFLQLKDQLKAKPLNVEERFITSFKDTVIKKIHYPVEVRSNFGINQLDYYVNQKFNSNSTPATASSIDDNSDINESIIDLGLFTHIDDLGTVADGIQDTVDLLGNVNPESSLLNNDYDPLMFNDPNYRRQIIFQEASKEYFDDYFDDRQLLAKMSHE